MDRKNLPSLLLCYLLSVASLGTVHAAQLPTDAYDPFDPLGPFDSSFNADDLMKYLSQLEPPVEQPKPVETKKDPQVKTAAVPTREEKDTTDIFLNSFLTDRKPKKDEKQKSDPSRFGYDRPLGKKQEEAVKISDKEHNAFIICKGRLTKPLMTIEDNILTLGINAPDTLKALKSNLYSLQASLGTIAQKHHFYLRYMLIKERQKPIGQRVVDAINKLEALKIEKKLAFTEGYENLLDLEAQPVMSASERSTMIEKILSINSTLLDPLVKELETFVKEPSVVKAVDDKSKQREDATKELSQRGRWRNYGTDYRGPARAGSHGSRTPPNYWDNPNNWGKSGYYDPYESYKDNKNNKDPKAEPAKPDQADDKKKASGGAPGKTYDEKEAERIQKKVKKELDDFSKNDDIKRLLALTNAPVLDPQLTDVVLDETVERAIKKIEEIQRHVSQLSTAATPLQPESKSTPTTKTTAAQPKPTSAQLARQGSEKDADDTPTLLKQIEPQLKQYYSLMSKLAAPTANLYAHLVREPFHEAHRSRAFPIMPASTSGEFARLGQTKSVERLRSIVCAINLDKGNSLKTTYDNFYNKRKTQIDAYETKRGAELAKYFDELREKIEKCNTSLEDSLPTSRSPETFFQDFLTSLQAKLKGPGKNDKTVIESLKSLTLYDDRGRLWNLLFAQITPSTKNIFAIEGPAMQALLRLCSCKPKSLEIKTRSGEIIPTGEVITWAAHESGDGGLENIARITQFINQQIKFVELYSELEDDLNKQGTIFHNDLVLLNDPIEQQKQRDNPAYKIPTSVDGMTTYGCKLAHEQILKALSTLKNIKTKIGEPSFPTTIASFNDQLSQFRSIVDECNNIIKSLYNTPTVRSHISLSSARQTKDDISRILGAMSRSGAIAEPFNFAGDPHLLAVTPMVSELCNLLIAHEDASFIHPEDLRTAFPQALVAHKTILEATRIISAHAPENIKKALLQVKAAWTSKPMATTAGAGSSAASGSGRARRHGAPVSSTPLPSIPEDGDEDDED